MLFATYDSLPNPAIADTFGRVNNASGSASASAVSRAVLDFSTTGTAPKPQLTAAAATALEQPFEYLSEGGSALAFVSADGKYVLKLFKQPAAVVEQYAEWAIDLATTNWITTVPGDAVATAFNMQHLALRNAWFAFRDLARETALLHINSAPSSGIPTVAIDGQPVEAGAVPFILQKRVTTVGEVFDGYRRRDDDEAACRAIKRIVEHLGQFWRTGWIDLSRHLSINVGYDVDGELIMIDVCDLIHPTNTERYQAGSPDGAIWAQGIIDDYIETTARWLQPQRELWSEIFLAEMVARRSIDPDG